jgi:hypothetical protein
VNGKETAAAERILETKRAVHLVDAVAIRKALLGTPTALTEIEQGAAITICEVGGLSRDLTAQGLGLERSSIDQLMTRRRRELPAAEADALVAAMADRAQLLIAAVADRKRAAVAEVLQPMPVTELHALAIALADMLAAPERGAVAGGRR